MQHADERSSSASAIVAASTLRTPWDEPDLQGIWTDAFDTPFQRLARFANQNTIPRDSGRNWTKSDPPCSATNERQKRGSEVDVAGAYNGVFLTVKRTGVRTSRIVPPGNARA